MATASEHFALDWIKSDLIETLNEARVALDDYAEQGSEETRIRACLTSLHQVHGTLVMLELDGVTLLADHLEQLAQAMMSNQINDLTTAGQSLMQGILELPGYLDELQRGAEDSTSPFIPLVNEIRGLMGVSLLEDSAGTSLTATVTDEVVDRYQKIGGPEKVARIRSAYQNVLLSILKGDDREAAVRTLRKIATGLERLSEGSPLQRQWQAFGEFVISLSTQQGALESGSVKLLRRVDLEIKHLAKDGTAALRRPVNMDLIQQLLRATQDRDHNSVLVDGLQQAVLRDVEHSTLAISGRQALSSAAEMLREELAVVKDRLDLLVRAERVDLETLRGLVTPLNQIASTLSVLAFESSREIVADQIAIIENLVVLGDDDPQNVQGIASALIQIDENLNTVVQGSNKTEVEQITGDAQLQVLREARNGLELVKQGIVDFVTTHWDVRHLETLPDILNEICGALAIMPLQRAISILQESNKYIGDRLARGYRPDWQELDQFADIVSAVDYYLERLAEENASGAEEVLGVAERCLQNLDVSVFEGDEPTQELTDEAVEIPAPSEAIEVDEKVEVSETVEVNEEIALSEENIIDETNLETLVEHQLVVEQEVNFDLSGDVFADIDGVVETQSELEAEVAASVDAPDPEIVEIFVEEIDEVIQSINQALPQWAQSFELGEPLNDIRRAFHTLKGSGRIVQAAEIGELAWGIENMLNRVIDNTVEANPQFVEVIKNARDLVPALRDAFEQGRPGDLEAINAIIEQADILASGGEIHPSQDTQDVAAEVEETSLQATDVQVTDVQETEDSVDAASVQDSTLALFIAEVDEHLAVIDIENKAQPWFLSEAIARAFHTLAGSAAMADIQSMLFVADPAYQVVEAFRNRTSDQNLQEFFIEAANHVRDCVNCLRTGTHWDEPLAFVAVADDLIVTTGDEPTAISRLLEAPATAQLFDAESHISKLVEGETASIGPVLNALTDIIPVAIDSEEDNFGELAVALLDSLTRASVAGKPSPEASTAIRQGYDALIEQLNTLAGGGTVATQQVLIESLSAINFASSKADQEVQQVEQPLELRNEDEVIEASDRLAVDKPVGSAAGETVQMPLEDVDDDLIEVFFEEAEEINEELDTNMISWSQEMDNRIYMENMLRGLHTLKGGARLCGLSDLGDMAHEFESTVINVQNDVRAIDEALFADLHGRYDAIVDLLNAVKAAVSAVPSSSEAGSESVGESVEAPLPVISEDTVQNVEGAVEAKVAPAVMPEVVPSSTAKVEPETVALERPSQEMVRVGSSLLEELVNLAGENSILRARVEQGMSDFTGALDEMETTIERLREQLRRLEIETETQILFRHDRSDGPQYDNFDPLEMDRYSQLQQLSRGLSESASDMLDLKDTLLFKARESETLLLQQARINTELQEGLMRTRMVPFSRLLPRLRRIVRQVSAELEKEVEFHVQNAEGELDRNLLERMVPPLEHMLRNALDHGIESTELRRNFGKPAKGRIDLRILREGGDVVIEISDDGAGIDVETVRAKALERGLMAEDASLSDEEIQQFVLAPGFSTAKAVTQISGRGVGMDVVHSEVKQLGGSINIVSRPGQGARFILRVPFTVSVNRALMVSVAADMYAIPLNTIEGIVLLDPEQLRDLYASEGKAFEYAGVPYRVRYLGQYLGKDYRDISSSQSSVPVVLVRSGDHAVAIHVDTVQGSREIVVKSLGPQFAGVGGISGATILGDGSVVVILDLLALIRAQHRQSQQRQSTSQRLEGRPRCIMVVDDSVTVRKVTSRILERQGMDVMVAKDGVEAVAMLQERRPDVMLLDIEMPRMDGFEVARQIRHDDRLDNLPIVMISSRTGDKHKEHASQLGVNKFLGKPFQESELLATIDELVTRS